MAHTKQDAWFLAKMAARGIQPACVDYVCSVLRDFEPEQRSMVLMLFAHYAGFSVEELNAAAGRRDYLTQLLLHMYAPYNPLLAKVIRQLVQPLSRDARGELWQRYMQLGVRETRLEDYGHRLALLRDGEVPAVGNDLAAFREAAQRWLTD